MVIPESDMARQIAQAAVAFEQRRTGHGPRSVSVVLSDKTLVITLHEALSAAEKVLAKTAEGAAKLQEFHRQLFITSSASLQADIQRITGIAVGEAAAEVSTATGSAVQLFTTGTMVQIFLLASSPPAATWSGTDPSAEA